MKRNPWPWVPVAILAVVAVANAWLIFIANRSAEERVDQPAPTAPADPAPGEPPPPHGR